MTMNLIFDIVSEVIFIFRKKTGEQNSHQHLSLEISQKHYKKLKSTENTVEIIAHGYDQNILWVHVFGTIL